MPFFKTASIPIVSVYQSSGKFLKCATKTADTTKDEQQTVKRAINLISPEFIKAIAKIYNLSDKIDDYIFPVPRAVTADVPNSNADRFAHEELIRFSPDHKCLVYKTFRNVPLHIEHAAHDPKAARGFIPDSHYIQANPKDKYVLTVVAMDTSKDPPLASGLLDGSINKFSMGCICDSVQCSYCKKIAKSDNDLCDHLLWHKMSRINGTLVYEDCLGVEYQELSVVGDPADEKALTQMILHHSASKEKRVETTGRFSLLSSLVSNSDQLEIARYFRDNAGKLPEALLRLADKIL